MRDGIPREVYVERVEWARQARSAALFHAFAAALSWPIRVLVVLANDRRRRVLR